MKYFFLIILFLFNIFQLSYANQQDSLKIEKILGDITQLIYDYEDEQALTICKKTLKEDSILLMEYPLLQAKIEQKIGVIYNNLGSSELNYQQSSHYHHKVLRTQKKYLSPEDPVLLHTYYLLFHLNTYQRKHDIVIQYGRFIVQHMIPTSRRDSSKLGFTYRRLGKSYIEKSDFKQGALYLNQALIIFENLNDTKNIAEVFNEYGALYEYMEQYSLAIEN